MSKKEDLITAAIKEFGEYSYDNASINRIIKASGTSKGTFYHYFRDKKDLYFTIIESAIKIKMTYFFRMMADIGCDENDFFDVMKSQVKVGMNFMRENPDLYQFGTRYVKEQGAIKSEIQEKYIPNISNPFLKIVEAGVAGKNFSKRYPPEFTAKIICFLMMNYYDILFDAEETPSPEQIEEKLDLLFDFMKRGLS